VTDRPGEAFPQDVRERIDPPHHQPPSETEELAQLYDKAAMDRDKLLRHVWNAAAGRDRMHVKIEREGAPFRVSRAGAGFADLPPWSPRSMLTTSVRLALAEGRSLVAEAAGSCWSGWHRGDRPGPGRRPGRPGHRPARVPARLAELTRAGDLRYRGQRRPSHRWEPTLWPSELPDQLYQDRLFEPHNVLTAVCPSWVVRAIEQLFRRPTRAPNCPSVR